MDPVPTLIPRVSVCMAAYNGANHIREQIESILLELSATDELVIIDDCSTDSTKSVVEGIGDPRIRLIAGTTNAGYVRTFERALSESRGRYVFLSDQDDIWIPGRTERMIAGLQDKDMVVSNCRHFDGPLGRFHRIRLKAKDSNHTLRNLAGIVIGYRLHWGCAMAFRRELLPKILPFPAHMRESHDQWIAMVGIVNRSIRYLEEDTILHRLHGENLTPQGIRSAGKIFAARLDFFRNLLIATRRALAN
ncbi:glycosyltransferase [Arthrobacter sp. HMWF013]|uniref:glycosyltransferase n=1 Tax=Arthrobacter sp. HMWF013 TaxID=2056849 RepID=UPI000D35D8B6|nr:glycosyltransferase [Arthrobacter sp. HMWF013]PTT68607.1 glycosyl transferase [Arthrobacter sp. HMWF013]